MRASPTSSAAEATPTAAKPTGRERLRSVGQWALVIALLLGVRAFTHRGIAEGAAPSLVGRDLDGKGVTLADFRGKPVLVHFWATWCGVCEAESGTLDTPVEYLCEVAHEQARDLGLLEPGACAWHITDWKARVERI